MEKVLFACAENKKRSQMAEAIFNHFAKNAVAKSAGTMPAQEVDPKVKEALAEIGIAISDDIAPKKVNNEMLANANLIISFGCLVAALFPKEKFEEWQVSDPQTTEEFRTVRDDLVARIKTLIQERNF